MMMSRGWYQLRLGTCGTKLGSAAHLVLEVLKLGADELVCREALINNK